MESVKLSLNYEQTPPTHTGCNVSFWSVCAPLDFAKKRGEPSKLIRRHRSHLVVKPFGGLTINRPLKRVAATARGDLAGAIRGSQAACMAHVCCMLLLLLFCDTCIFRSFSKPSRVVMILNTGVPRYTAIPVESCDMMANPFSSLSAYSPFDLFRPDAVQPPARSRYFWHFPVMSDCAHC